MAWNGKQFDKPLVMLRRENIYGLRTAYGYDPGDDVLEIYPTEELSAELALNVLMLKGETEEAVNLLASAIVPRVGVWWAYLCLQMVFEDIRLDFEKDGLTPREREAKQREIEIKELTDTSKVDKMFEAQDKYLDEYAKKVEEDVRKLGYLNPIQRIELKLQYIKREFERFKNELPEGALGDPNGPMMMEAQMKKKMSNVQTAFESWLHKDDEQPLPADCPIPPTEKIFDEIRKQTAAIGPSIEKRMAKHFPLKLKGLPKPVSPKRKTAAVEAALRWLLVPSDANGKLACDAAVAAKEGPESMLAYAAFWSSTNLQTETGAAPTNLALPPMGISKTLLLLALLEGGEMDYDARYKEFLRLGIECADGTCTWDEHGKPIRHEAAPGRKETDDRVFGARYGFGRNT